MDEYDSLVTLFVMQEERHQREMHEAVSSLLRRRPVPRRTVKTYVYLIANEDRTQVKIGVSTNPERRLRTLSTANACALHLLYQVVGGRSAEKALHDKFKKHHIRNEWYSNCLEIENEFARLSGVKKAVTDGLSDKTEV